MGAERAMGIKRYELSEAQWSRVASLVPDKAADPGRTGADNRLFVNVCRLIALVASQF